jgi:hypothetical protein
MNNGYFIIIAIIAITSLALSEHFKHKAWSILFLVSWSTATLIILYDIFVLGLE